jgi:hypothetical protein
MTSGDLKLLEDNMKPKKGETIEDFKKRFMIDEGMMKSFPEDKQREEACIKEFEQAKEVKTVTKNNVEIFKTGIWNGDKYTKDDFDDMVKAHAEIGDKIKPFMKLGHAENQKLLQKDGYPSAGWIQNVRRIGESLIVDLVGIPGKIAELIEKKAYGRFSPEIYWNYNSEENGKKYSRVLKACALLGGDTPACTTIDDFINLYEELIDVKKYEDTKNLKTYEALEKFTSMEDEMDPVKEKEYADKLAEKDTEIEKLKVYKNKADQLENEKFGMTVDSFIKDSAEKITPAQIKAYKDLIMMDRGVKVYSEDKSEKSIFDLVKAIVKDMPKFVNYGKESNNVAPEKGDDDDGTALDNKVKE